MTLRGEQPELGNARMRGAELAQDVYGAFDEEVIDRRSSPEVKRILGRMRQNFHNQSGT